MSKILKIGAWLCMLLSSLAAIVLGLIGFFNFNAILHNFGSEASKGSHLFFIILTVAALAAFIPQMRMGLHEVSIGTIPFGTIPSFFSAIGAIYMGLLGLFYYQHLVGTHSSLTHVIYAVIGLAGIWTLYFDVIRCGYWTDTN